MELSKEDSLRLHVLLNQSLQAVRIDEGAMVLHALTDRGAAQVPLNPTCRDEQYLRLVRELLSTHVLGSPGGYPVFLRRWTRMGQARSQNLDKLLLLGEPEAVVAVVHAEGLTNELARRAWWIMPTAENARRMLEKEDVVRGDMGPELASFLVEFLPFEEDSRDILDSIRLVLQPGLIDESTRETLWRRAKQKSVYYVGFLSGAPDSLPEQEGAHPLRGALVASDAAPAAGPLVELMQHVLDAPAQTFVRVALDAMRKPRDQEVVIALFNAIGRYFRPCERVERQDTIEGQVAAVDAALADANNAELAQFQATYADCRDMLRAALIIAGLSDRMLSPILSRTDAMGSVLRRKLEPVTTPVRELLQALHAGGTRR